MAGHHNSPVYGANNNLSSAGAVNGGSVNCFSSPGEPQQAFMMKLHQKLLNHQQKQNATEQKDAHFGDQIITSDNSEQFDQCNPISQRQLTHQTRPCQTSRRDGQQSINECLTPNNPVSCEQYKNLQQSKLAQLLQPPPDSNRMLAQKSMITDSLEGTAQKDTQLGSQSKVLAGDLQKVDEDFDASNRQPNMSSIVFNAPNCQGKKTSNGQGQDQQQKYMNMCAQGKRQPISQMQRAELVMKLAQYIKMSDANDTPLSDCFLQQVSPQTNSSLWSDVIQLNLRKFLQYLEQNQVININEIEKDQNKMSKLINEVSQIDLQNLNYQDLISEYFSDNLQNLNFSNQENTQKPRSSSNGSHYGLAAAQNSGLATSTAGLNSEINNNYNTSGAINFKQINGDNRYFSTSSNQNGQPNNLKTSKQSGSSIFNMNTTATSGGGPQRSGNRQRVSQVQKVQEQRGSFIQRNKSAVGSLESQRRRKGTPLSIDGGQSRASINESTHNNHLNITRQKNLNSRERVRVSQTSGFSGNSNEMQLRRDSKQNSSQTRLNTSSSRMSNKYNTSGDQVQIKQHNQQSKQVFMKKTPQQLHQISTTSTPTPQRTINNAKSNDQVSNKMQRSTSKQQNHQNLQDSSEINVKEYMKNGSKTSHYTTQGIQHNLNVGNQNQYQNLASNQHQQPQINLQNIQQNNVNYGQLDRRSQPQPNQQHVHNTTINLQINANVENINLNGQIKQAHKPAIDQDDLNNQQAPQQQRLSMNSNHNTQLEQRQRQSIQSHVHQLNQQQQSKDQSHPNIFASNKVVSGGGLNANIMQILSHQKQKRGGSHEQQKDKIKQLLMFDQNDPFSKPSNKQFQPRNNSDNRDHNQAIYQMANKQQQVNHNKPKNMQSYHENQNGREMNQNHYVSRQINQFSRMGTAQANMKAFGINDGQNQYTNSYSRQHGSRPSGPTNSLNRVEDAINASSKSLSRRIHQKQQHLQKEQHQKLNDEIMLERDKIVSHIRQYTRIYQKFPQTCLDFYKFVKKIGKGAFGQVYLAIHKLTGKFVAIKLIELKQLEKKYSSKQKVFQEIYILKKIRHSNIIRLFEVFENKQHIMMVMEYAGGGDLFHLVVKQNKFLTEQETKYIFKQIAQGVAHCHCRSVLHRDIKLDNILLDGEGGVKICDFGVSRLVNKNEIIQEQCGTPAYLAPEISSNSKYSGFYVDIWSLGVLLYVMLQGTVPFKADKMEGLFQAQMRMNINFPVDISKDAQNLIRSMLQIKPQDRLSIPQILSHPWLKYIVGPDGLPLESHTEDEEDFHDFNMGFSFQRQECNLNPLSVNITPEQHDGQQNQGEITKRYQNVSNNTLQQLGNINIINIENLFPQDSRAGSYQTGHVSKNSQKHLSSSNPGQIRQCKLSYMNYCAVTQDFNTYHIEEEALRVLETFGFPRQMVIDSLNQGELNHATCSYNLLVME